MRHQLSVDACGPPANLKYFYMVSLPGCLIQIKLIEIDFSLNRN